VSFCEHPNCINVLIRAVVYLFLVSYGRSAKPDQINMVIPFFLQVSL